MRKSSQVQVVRGRASVDSAQNAHAKMMADSTPGEPGSRDTQDTRAHTCTGNTPITNNKPRTEGERHGKDGTTETHKHRTVKQGHRGSRDTHGTHTAHGTHGTSGRYPSGQCERVSQQQQQRQRRDTFQEVEPPNQEVEPHVSSGRRQRWRRWYGRRRS